MSLPYSPLFLRDPLHLPKRLLSPVIVIGNFDGVHEGHVGVIAIGQRMARRLGRPCIILTFEPHPSDFFARTSVIFRLTPEPLKRLALERLHPDGLVFLSFAQELANLSPHDFMTQILIQRFQAKGVVVGFDFCFGKGRLGTAALLKEMGEQYGFEVEIVPQISQNDALTVSSTAIRQALEEGDVAKARQLLGRPWSIREEVIHGQKMGRALGFPTANMAPDPSCRLRHGIYAVRFLLEGRLYEGVASYGKRPTFDNGAACLETHLFDFEDNIYEKMGEVFFFEWLRGEEKFPTIDLLITQMHQDVNEARERLKKSVGFEPGKV